MARQNLEIENADIFFRNFGGKAGTYNAEGVRSFCVSLDGAPAEEMDKDGWNVKWTKVREEGDEPKPYLQVSVSYKVRPPKVIMITSKGRTALNEEMLQVLDWVDLAHVDLIISPSKWSMNGNTGIKAYLDAIYITILENRFDRKYADVPEIGYDAPLEITAGPGDDILDGEVVEYDD